MFWTLLIIGIILGITAMFMLYNKGKIGIAIILIIVATAFVYGAFQVPQGKIYRKQLFASSISGNWLVVDNSGGRTMRHWILKSGYVKSADNSDGWQFYDNNGNLCYVSGDSFVMRIDEDIDVFIKTYKQKYNIPENQEALH